MRLLARLPLGVLYLLSDVAYPIVYHIIRYRRRLIRENLRCSFPDKSEQERLAIERSFYHNLCDTFVEAFKCLHISDQEMLRRVEVLGTEIPEKLAAEGRNIFMLLGHLGCWEWYQEVSERYRNPRRGAEIYKQIENKYFASLMHELRSRWNTTQIEMRQTVRTLLSWNSQGEPFLCGFISDQRPDTKGKDGVQFLNQYTWYAPGPEELARKVNASLVYLYVEKTARGHYRLTFREMRPTPQELSSAYPLSRCFWRMLEENIRQQPDIWLWSHNRWYKFELTK